MTREGRIVRLVEKGINDPEVIARRLRLSSTEEAVGYLGLLEARGLIDWNGTEWVGKKEEVPQSKP